VSAADLSRIVAIVPVRSLSGAKTRLGEPLDAEERAELIMALMRRTVRAALGSRLLAGVEVVSRDPELLKRARGMGAGWLLQRSDGLNESLVEARAAAPDATAVLVLPADLPRITAEAIDRLIETAAETVRNAPGRAVVVLAPDRHGSGTNALLMAPPGTIPFRFGEDSRFAHADAAAAVGAAYAEVAGPLAFDLDTPDDLLEADLNGLDHEAGR
jgi:2-phospho-L-lactate guanylyltransferase